MKRSIILKSYSLISATIYGLCLLIYFLCTESVFPLWFSLGCFFIGVYQLLRAWFFNQDGAFWFSCFLMFIAGIGFLCFFAKLSTNLLLPIYFFSLPFASFFTAIFYKKQLHYKISFILILEDFLILLYSVSIIPLPWLVFINIAMIFAVYGGKYVFNRK